MKSKIEKIIPIISTIIGIGVSILALIIGFYSGYVYEVIFLSLLVLSVILILLLISHYEYIFQYLWCLLFICLAAAIFYSLYPETQFPYEKIAEFSNSTNKPKMPLPLKELKELHSQLGEFFKIEPKDQILETFSKLVPKFADLKSETRYQSAMNLFFFSLMLFIGLISVRIAKQNSKFGHFGQQEHLTFGQKEPLVSGDGLCEWLLKKWESADSVRILTKDSAWANSIKRKQDPMAILASKEAATVFFRNDVKSQEIPDLFSSEKVSTNILKGWPIDYIIGSLTDVDDELSMRGISIINTDKNQEVLLTGIHSKSKNTGKNDRYCLCYSTQSEAYNHHPSATLALSYLNVVTDLWNNIIYPMRRIAKTYIATVKNTDGDIENIAIVRLAYVEHNDKKLSPGSLVYEGISVPLTDKDPITNLWQSDPICLDLFSLAPNKIPPLLLFQSDPEQIIELAKSGYRFMEKTKISHHFGELRFYGNNSKGKGVAATGGFFDVVLETTPTSINKHLLDLTETESILSQTDVEKFSALSKIDEIFAIARNVLSYAVTEKCKGDFELPGNVASAKEFMEMTEALLGNERFWSKDAPNIKYLSSKH